MWSLAELPAGGCWSERDWPLVGRDEHLALIRRARRARPARPIILGGGQGVGKSRLAAEALAEAQADRWAVERVDGAGATAEVPFGAVAHLVPAEVAAAGDPLQLQLAITGRLTQRAARRPLMLLVDDAQDLDGASLSVLRRVAAAPQLFLLVVVRSDQPVPPPLVGLWKDGGAERVEVGPLSRDETNRLAAVVLGGEVEAATLRRLWDRSLGNPLFLRELVLAAGGAGWRRRDDGRWTCAAGDLPVGQRLAELVRGELGHLDDDQRAVVETLTACGPLPLDQLAALVPLDAVTAVAGRGLVVTRSSPDVVVSLAHPLYGIVLGHERLPVRARELRRRFLEVLERTAELAPRDLIRRAALRLEDGVDIDPEELVTAAQMLTVAYPATVAERLADTPTVDAPAGGVPLSQDDMALHGRLSQRAWEADRSLPVGIEWATFLVATGQGAPAQALLEELEEKVVTEWDRTRLAIADCALQLWALGRPDEALRTLEAAVAAVADPSARQRLARERAGVLLNVGRLDEAIAITTGLIAALPPEEPVAVMAASPAVAALALAGRPREALEVADRFLAPALMLVAEAPEVLGQLMLGRLYAARLLGALDDAEAIGAACYHAAVDNGSPDAMGIFIGALGQVALDRGRPGTARRRLLEAETLLRERDRFGYRPWVLGCLAVALAQLGDVDAALAAITEAEALQPHARYFDADLLHARAWCHQAGGHRSEAVATICIAADKAREMGALGFEAAALHTAVRLGAPDAVAARLRALAASTGSPMVAAFAAHAHAAAGRSPAGLVEVSATFEGLGAELLAAEASAEAAALFHRSGRGSVAFHTAARVEALVERCEGARTPLLQLARQAPQLTEREQEVAALAAEGFTSKAIAERLVVSTRTVESHLYRIFSKLGVSDRTQLGTVLSPVR